MELIPEDMHPFMLEKWDEIQKGIGGVYETKVIKADGSIADCLVSHSKVEGMHEYLVILRDITESKKEREKLEKYVKELEKWHKVTIGREEKMIELKEEIKKLEKRLTKYNPSKE